MKVYILQHKKEIVKVLSPELTYNEVLKIMDSIVKSKNYNIDDIKITTKQVE